MGWGTLEELPTGRARMEADGRKEGSRVKERKDVKMTCWIVGD